MDMHEYEIQQPQTADAQASGYEIPSTPKHKSPFADSPYVSAYVEQAPAKPKKKKSSSAGKTVALTLLVIVFVIGGCLATAFLVSLHWQKQIDIMQKATDQKISVLQQQLNSMPQNEPQSGIVGTLPVDGLTPAQVYNQNVKAVVAISNQSADMFYGGTVLTSSGSGFLISADGYIVSNYHVVADAQTLTVETYDGQEYIAELVGYDSANDISLLKIEAEDLPFVAIGSSDALVVGDQVVAIGNPLGDLTATLTVGYISAKDRVISTDGTPINMLQTDAAINSGNSGGPLFNMKGEVVGITTAKYSGTSASGATIEGIGFAIPIDDVVGIFMDLKEFGYVTGAYLGVWVKDVEAVAQEYGLPAGAFISDVMDGYAAQKYGLKAQDIITNLGGYDVTSVNELSRILRKFKAGDTVVVTVYRSGSQIPVEVVLDEKPVELPEEEQQTPTAPEETFDFWDEWFKDFIG